MGSKLGWTSLLLVWAAACSDAVVADAGDDDGAAADAGAAGRDPAGPSSSSGSSGHDAGAPARDAAADAGQGELDAAADAADAALPVDPAADSVPADAAWLVQCYEGAGDPRISKVDNYCAQLTETTIPECTAGSDPSCEASWYYTHRTAAYAALFAALDTDHDGAVTEADTPQRLALFGHSWGGTNVIDSAAQLLADERVTPSRRYVHLAVTWDPFRPLFTLNASANLKRLWVLRQSDPTDDECEAQFGVFRYEGLPPKCPAGQACRDFDYSLSPLTSFPTQAGGSYLGGQIGHCRVPDVGFPVAVALLHDAALPPLPAEVPVGAP